MRKWIVAAALVLGVGLLAQASAAGPGGNNDVLRWKTMAGVVAPFTGATNPIRNIPGGGAPWRIDNATGKLKENGELSVEVEGLVLTGTGQNPQAAFRAVVSCLSIDAGAPVTINRVTAPFPATTTGDAAFEGAVDLPSPCFAPIVFVTTGAGDPPRWFSVTGA